ncbi:MAG TPA: hypothetical protein VM370_05395 [Candidatus Thermoplasmatota archaeon]|nr:hypothetical protein [Candidatus Thermoplasmatota archaeon]
MGPPLGPPRSPVRRRPKLPLRGINGIAELEAICVLGGGKFEVGIHHAMNIFRGLPLASVSGTAIPEIFDGRTDKRLWARAVYEEDAYTLQRMSGGTSAALTLALSAAWPHVAAPYRERALARIAELPDDGLSRAWETVGGARWWAPPTTGTEQLHFVEASDIATHSLGIAP